ncbi:MAG: hypothetical protein V7K32_08435 [Nostoc sp.]|uniref:hypothetical protein n=1 Tax=Nostoc sp. TaxID=1180 RepID=UPI002FFCA5A4
MNRFSSAEITASPQFPTPIIEQPDQTHLIYRLDHDQIESLSGSLLFVACVCIAAVFFYMGFRVGKRHIRHHELMAIRLRQIQFLERIWQMTDERRD